MLEPEHPVVPGLGRAKEGSWATERSENKTQSYRGMNHTERSQFLAIHNEAAFFQALAFQQPLSRFDYPLATKLG